LNYFKCYQFIELKTEIMTILTKALSEKKLDNLKEPLVDDCLHSTPPQVDIENGSNSSIETLRSRAQRVSSLTTLCVTLTALLVLTTGIVGGIYLYRQFAQYRLRHFRGWCSIPYVEPSSRYDSLHQSHQTSKPPKHEFDALKQENVDIENMWNDLAKQMRETIDDSVIPHNNDNSISPFNKFFNEEFDIDVEFEQYEKIEVPDFSHGRRGRFIHDFAKNKTGIIDIEEGRCFVLPLNRSQVLPPQSLFDLVVKMRTGYYDIDTEIVREMYRVVTPPITDFKDVGYYIGRECAKMPTYRLERITSPVYKRSISENGKVVFSEFAGIKIHEFEIVNLNSAKGNK
jgi:integral membrane protein 2B